MTTIRRAITKCGQSISLNGYSIREHEAECEYCQKGLNYEDENYDASEDRRLDSPTHTPYGRRHA